jgi:MGT family glycosyltransferase
MARKTKGKAKPGAKSAGKAKTKAGARRPAPKPAKKPSGKKPVARKTAAKKAAPKKPIAKPVAKKPVAMKPVAKPAPKPAKKQPAPAPKQAAQKQAAAKQAAPKPAPAKAADAKSSAPKAPAKKQTAPKPQPVKPPQRILRKGKTIVFYPEAAFGPALNSVGIAQRLKKLGHNPIFVCDAGFKGVFEGYGFPEYLVDMSGGMPAEEAARFWADFIAGHLPHFHLSPLEQVRTYVVPVWEMIVDTAINSHEMLTAHLQSLKPDVVCVDNVILFPAIKSTGKPWVRIVSCSENEVEDPNIPPHLSGCSEGDFACYEAYNREFLDAVKPCHDRFNAFLTRVGLPPYKLGEFFETSPWMNLLLYPSHLRFNRTHPLDPAKFQYLDGCVRDEGTYRVPIFATNNNKPLIYVSFGSLGAADIDLYKRMIALFGTLPYRFLMNIGEHKAAYENVPGNVILEGWFPQPAVLPHVSLFVHHGGNNSFNEALYFGKPSIIMPYCWDGLDNATRIDDTGYGAKLPRYDWTEEQFAKTIARLLSDREMAGKLVACSKTMQAARGPEKAARLIAEVAKNG